MPSFRIVDRLQYAPGADVRTLAAGLSAVPATIAPKHFYDPLGCALYGAICQLPEYYLPRAEQAIFSAHRDAIVAAAGAERQFVDLGAGDGAKAQRWLPLLASTRYVAVDIAREAVAQTLARMAPDFPRTEMIGVVTDFDSSLDLADDLGDMPATFFYPGSSIGNFAPDAARRFLAAIHRHCLAPGSGLLIGVDTKKGKARLEAAYDDAVGVTAAFNRNVLVNVNRVLGSDFRPREFAHVALYDAAHGRIEMHLEAIAATTVCWPGGMRSFVPGERIHTENSYKYAPAEFTALLQAAGFRSVQVWQDEARDFAVFWAS